MANRYIDIDEFIKWTKEYYCTDCNNNNGLRCRICWIDDAIDLVDEAPTADVVPRSVITEIFAELDAFVNLLCTDNDDKLIYSEIRKKYLEGSDSDARSASEGDPRSKYVSVHTN